MRSSKKRRIILEFFNTATDEDLVRMPRCSTKKAELIKSLRPFSDWDDLVSRGLS